MKLEDQVCNIAQSIKLYELGITGESVWWHRNDYPNNPDKYPNEWSIIPGTDYPYTYNPKRVEKYEYGYHLLPAWGVAELGLMLGIDWENGIVAAYEFIARTEAQERAHYLIGAIESGQLTVEEINNRLKRYP